jgi:hypothetical protein
MYYTYVGWVVIREFSRLHWRHARKGILTYFVRRDIQQLIWHAWDQIWMCWIFWLRMVQTLWSATSLTPHALMSSSSKMIWIYSSAFIPNMDTYKEGKWENLASFQWFILRLELREVNVWNTLLTKVNMLTRSVMSMTRLRLFILQSSLKI